MHLTDHTDYSLRVLMYLNEEKRLVTLNELAEKVGVSKNNLIKVSNQLAKLNFIETSRGRSGGLTIREETGSRSLKEIIMKTEPSFYIAGCFGQNCECLYQNRCSLKRSLADALQAFLGSLAQKTLNDVTPKIR
jgi:Rrf2 family nitric oxide-sensitive transcriptional repressor